MNRLKANIDNRNILEDFTEDFHGGRYIERITENLIHQVFYMEGCLCELTYRFSQNWFRCRIIEGNPEDVRKCSTTIEKVVISLNGDNVKVIFNPMLGVYEFYFVES